MISHQIKTALLASAFLTCAFASESFAETDKKVVIGHVIASLNFADGTTLQYQETSPGELAVAAQGRNRSKDGSRIGTINGVSITKLSHLNAVDLYKAVTGSSVAPFVVMAAQQRADSFTNLKFKALPKNISKKIPLPFSDKKAYKDANKTESALDYCQVDNWYVCFPYQLGDQSYQKIWTYYIKNYVDVYRGSVYLSVWRLYPYWRPPFYAWHHAIGQWIGEGNWGWVAAWGGSPYKKSTVEYASDSGYHWSVSGH